MSFESYVVKNGKKYRRGYTTGSAAAAAAKAATLILFNKKRMETVKLSTPSGIELELELEQIEEKDKFVRVAIIKDAGDDPDVTDGILVYARVEELSNKGVVLEGGKGVGKVTKPGLAVKIGEPAINPVPRKMIKNAVKNVLPPGKGVRVTIEIPEGVEIAKKTFNPKLGIKGGISVLGTSGIVEPMSETAYRESLAIELKQAVALGEKNVVLVFGNYGKKLANKLGYNIPIIRMSNFVAYMLDESIDLGIENIVMIGHIGKIVKVAGGIFNTHSHLTDARKEIIAAYTAYCRGSQELINKNFSSNTAEEAANLLLEAEMKKVFNLLAKRVVIRVREHVDNKIDVKSIIFSMDKGILGTHGIEIEENYNE